MYTSRTNKLKEVLSLSLILLFAFCYTNTTKAQENDTIPKEGNSTIENRLPQFPGGEKAMIKFIADSLQYPAISKEVQASGQVFLRFLVQSDGTIANIEVTKNTTALPNKKMMTELIRYTPSGKIRRSVIILKDIQDQLANECIRIIKTMPKWEPAVINGEVVPAHANIPISFTLK